MQLFDAHDTPPGHWRGLDDAGEHLLSLRRRLKPTHDLTEGSGRVSNAGCIEFYRQMVCRRLLDLTEGIRLMWRAELQVPCLIQVRALLETVVALNHFVQGVRRFDPLVDHQELHDFITDVVFSSRDPEKIQRLALSQTTNVLTQMNGIPPEFRDTLRSFYEQICDHCHPNGYAMYQRYGDILDATFVAQPADHGRAQTFAAVANTGYLLGYADGMMQEIDGVIGRVRSAGADTDGGGVDAGG